MTKEEWAVLPEYPGANAAIIGGYYKRAKMGYPYVMIIKEIDEEGKVVKFTVEKAK